MFDHLLANLILAINVDMQFVLLILVERITGLLGQFMMEEP